MKVDKARRERVKAEFLRQEAFKKRGRVSAKEGGIPLVLLFNSQFEGNQLKVSEYREKKRRAAVAWLKSTSSRKQPPRHLCLVV